MFTREQIEEIARALQSTGAKDSSFPETEQVSGDDYVMLLKDRQNYRAKISSFYSYLSEHLIEELEAAISQEIDKVLESIDGITPDIEEYIREYFSGTVMPEINKGFNTLTGSLQDMQTGLEEKLDAIQSYLESTIDSKIQEVLDSLKFTEVLEAIAKLNSDIGLAIENLGNQLSNKIDSGFSSMNTRFNEIKSLLDTISAKIASALSEILGKIDDVHSDIVAKIEEAEQSLSDNIDTTREQIIAAITAAQVAIINNDNTNCTTILQKISASETAIIQSVTEAYNNLLVRLNRVEQTLQTEINEAETSIKSAITSSELALGTAIAEVQNVLTQLVSSMFNKVNTSIDENMALLENRIKFTQDWLEQWWSTMVTLKVTCPMDNAEILLNGNDIPQITVPVGSNVNVQVSAEGYYRFHEIVNVWRDTTVDIILENRNPLNEAILEIHPTPVDATVYLDDVEKWRTVVVPGSIVHVKVEAEDYVTYEEDITVNGDMILNIELDPVKVPFTVNAMPDGCTVLINGAVAENGTAMVDKNSMVNWEVSKTGYVTQSGQKIADQDTNEISVTLVLQQIIVTIHPIPEDSAVILNEMARNIITVPYGTEITYEVSHRGYVTATGTHTAVEDTTIDVILERNYVILPDAQINFIAAGETKKVDVQSNTNWIFR